jgi:Na+-translocating ferredoxin:NAD+ oxidoreductase RnfG subunit
MLFCIPIIYSLTIAVLSGCSNINYLQDEQNVSIFQNVFSEVKYYTYDNTSEIYTLYNNNKNQIGYLFYANGMGEAIDGKQFGIKIPGPIVILVGLEDKETIHSIFVVSHSETYGFWEYLVKRNYFNQFEGLKIEDSYFIEAGGKVDSVSSANISSNISTLNYSLEKRL